MYQNLGRIYRRWIVPRVLKTVHKVITVSDYEQQNIKAAFPQLSQHIITVYNGVSPRFRQLSSFSDSRFAALENGSYWLLLGNTDPKKNLKNTLRAYAYYLQESVFKKKMLLADLDEEHLDQLLTELDLHAIKEYLILEEYIAHDLLVEVYNKAFAFLYPSIRESFGLPLLEAMACGTPVITSNTSAIPEVAQDAVVYIDPSDISSIGDGMLKLENDAILYKTLVGKGFVRSAQFDWNQTAAKTLDIYEAVHLSK